MFYKLDYKEIFVQPAMISFGLHLAQIHHLGIKLISVLFSLNSNN